MQLNIKNSNWYVYNLQSIMLPQRYKLACTPFMNLYKIMSLFM